ncbi:hypothetical protein GCM10010392_42650 [Streptomyces clavifer]|nr:hypothetical protein GCM10010392_42650 [Streptomyces clavifer]
MNMPPSVPEGTDFGGDVPITRGLDDRPPGDGLPRRSVVVLPVRQAAGSTPAAGSVGRRRGKPA